MSASPAPRPRAFWTDARFLLGIVLVVVSVAGVWSVVAIARQTVPVLAAGRTITVGETLEAHDLRVVDVSLASLREAYLAPGELEPGAVAVRTIGDGELVPTGAVVGHADLEVTTVVVSLGHAVPASVAAGSRVEVWHAPQQERGVFDEPRILVADATVRDVRVADGVMAQATADVELVVDRSDVAPTLAAIARGDAISVIPTGAP
ncbi:SAF domain-containing protein [Microbacterium oleivorans]|uniref:SAF domain-containing protein n=1 Tax=Microbacterium oleivorans TaxID=273677 RepID=A0A7D5ITT3_9MICO|nr:SAF domain-containing protein [Microbacterium oleivorans]QLD12597.1 SAF domain-containing protein [Microbacterium oleivorans]